MHTVLTILAYGAAGGVFGTVFNELWTRRHRKRRHRGEHLPWWRRRAPRVDPYTSTDVPHTELTSGDAVTQKIPLPRDGNS